MKYATFRDFVREAYYHGVDLMELEISFREYEEDELSPDIWRNTLQDLITRKEFAHAEAWVRMGCDYIKVAGVITYLPTEEAVQRAYQLEAVENGG